jgi:hypothetical protein
VVTTRAAAVVTVTATVGIMVMTTIGTGWTADGTTNVGGQDYHVYTAGQATLLVDTDITANV